MMRYAKKTNISRVFSRTNKNQEKLTSKEESSNLNTEKYIRRGVPNKEYDPIRSLFYNYQNIKDIDLTEIARRNKKSIYEGMLSQNGPKSLMEKEDIEKVNILADIQLKNIAESGLCREEILGLKVKGKPFPIVRDPFFKLILKDHKTRFNLIKNSEEYTVEKIVSLALRQDTGADTSMIVVGNRIRSKITPYNSSVDTLQNNVYKDEELSDFYKTPETPTPFDYKQEEQMEIFKPVKKEPERIKKEVTLDKLDIHWRNTEFLCEFLTNFSRIKHRRVTGLSKSSHGLVARTIKHSRNLNLMPNAVLLKPQHRQSLKTLEEDMLNDTKFGIDLETGAIQKEENEETFQFRTNHFNYSHGFLKKIDLNELKARAYLIEDAKIYARHLKLQYLRESGLLQNEENETKKIVTEGILSLRDEKVDETNIDQYRSAYNQIRETFSNLALENFMDCLLNEKSDDYQGLVEIQSVSATNLLKDVDQYENNYTNLLADIRELKTQIDPRTANFPKNFFANTNLEMTVDGLTKSDKRSS